MRSVSPEARMPRDAAPPTRQAPGGFAVGRLVLDALEERGVRLDAWQWVYDPSDVRERPFEEHRELAGRIFNELPTPGGWAPGDHKGCVLPGTVIDAAGVSALTLRWYEGVVVRLATAFGEELAITPNHPVLTDEGWVAAGRIVEGDHVVRCLDAHRAANLVPDVHYRPALVEDVFASGWRSHQMMTRRMPVAPEHFHGDGVGGHVYVVLVDGDLRSDGHASVGEPTGHASFSVVGGLGQPLAGAGSTDAALHRIGSAPLGVVGGGSQSLSLGGAQSLQADALLFRGGAANDSGPVEPSVDGAPGHPEPLGERQDRLSISVAGDDCVDIQGEAAPWGGSTHSGAGDSRSLEGAVDGAGRDAEALGESLEGISGLIALDKVVDVDLRAWAGHVFNLETVRGWYAASSTIVHNCRCDAVPRLRDTTTAQFARTVG